MPTRVHNPTHTPEPHLHPLNDHDPRNKNWAHREALHHALGSILAPKRPNSRSTSGSLSPTHSGSPTPGTRTPVHPAPLGLEYLHPHHASHYRDAHPHTPSKLGQSSSATSQEGSPRDSHHSSPTMGTAPMMLPLPEVPELGEHMQLPSPAVAPAAVDSYVPPPSPGLGPVDDANPRLRHLRPTLTPLQLDGAGGKAVSLPTDLPRADKRKQHPVVILGTPKAKFFETLQGKGAWDALIHGSFS